MAARKVPRRTSQAAGGYLEYLLLKEPYFRRWCGTDSGTPPQSVDQHQVCRVLTQYECQASGIDFDPADDKAIRQHKDRVSRALSGAVLTDKTAKLFIRAFKIANDDAKRLLALRAGAERSPIIKGQLRPADESGFSYPHDTILLHESHYLGRDGQPVRHRSMQTIRSRVDRMTHYQFRYLTDAQIDLTVVRGGKRDGDPYDLGAGVSAIDIALHNPLEYGHTASLEYVCEFQTPTEWPLHFNRAVFNRVDNLEICIVFDPRRPPRSVFWAEWDSYALDAVPIYEEVWRLDGDSVHRSLIFVQRAVFGFRWIW